MPRLIRLRICPDRVEGNDPDAISCTTGHGIIACKVTCQNAGQRRMHPSDIMFHLPQNMEVDSPVIEVSTSSDVKHLLGKAGLRVFVLTMITMVSTCAGHRL